MWGSGVGNAGCAEFLWMHRKRGIKSAIFWAGKYILKECSVAERKEGANEYCYIGVFEHTPGKGTALEELGSLSGSAYLVMRLATSIKHTEFLFRKKLFL